ncbi:MAG: protein phosphatase 2C domain-containing protein [Propionibacteriales bacterium]|nr:protein phosphatase 2C domain-containing protein [Propionibacteriales bacterium]
MSLLTLRFAATSDVGRVRRDNQDSGYVGPHLLVVADGVGGAARGDIASSATVETLRKLDEAPTGGTNADSEALSALAATIHLAHDRLAEIVEAHAELDGTSTTLTAAVFDGDQLHVGHVGDSRGYLLRDGVLQQFTSDHSLVQSLVDEGRITEEEARVHPHRNLILKAIDSVHEPEPDLFVVPVLAGDRLLLCTDGCSGALENDTLAALLVGDDLTVIADRLVHASLEAGSSDNVTVVLAEVTVGPGGTTAPVVVGAAALAPHLQIADDTETGNLTESDVEDLSTVPLDPETIRYAPLPPPRHRGLRRLLALVVVLALLGGAGYAGYAYSQTRYFLKPGPADQVIIYRGVDLTLFGAALYDARTDTGFTLGDLDETFANRIRADHPTVKNTATALLRLRESCERAVAAAEAAEPVSPFGIGQSAPGPIDPDSPPDCDKVP